MKKRSFLFFLAALGMGSVLHAVPITYVQVRNTLQPGTTTGIYLSSGTILYMNVSTISASGPATFSQLVTVSTSETISGTLGVTGATTLSSCTANGQLIGKGTVTNDAAAAGFIGEYISSSTLSTVMPSSGTWVDPVSVVLTAGDWDLTGMIVTGVGSSTTFISWDEGISATAGNSASGLTYAVNRLEANNSGTSNALGPAGSLTIANFRVSINTATTYYLKWIGSWQGGTPTIPAANLTARRRR